MVSPRVHLDKKRRSERPHLALMPGTKQVSVDEYGENVLQNTATVASGPTPAAFSWAYNDALQPYPYDPAKAREMVKAAGAEGATLTFYVTEGGSGMLDPVPMGTAIPQAEK